MRIEKFHLYLADLNPRFGSEPGKVRPVVVVQTDMLNDVHPSTIICPLTTQLNDAALPLRVRVSGKFVGLEKKSDILADQIRAIDNSRFVRHLGKLSAQQKSRLLQLLHTLLIK